MQTKKEELIICTSRKLKNVQQKIVTNFTFNLNDSVSTCETNYLDTYLKILMHMYLIACIWV